MKANMKSRISSLRGARAQLRPTCLRPTVDPIRIPLNVPHQLFKGSPTHSRTPSSKIRNQKRHFASAMTSDLNENNIQYEHEEDPSSLFDLPVNKARAPTNQTLLNMDIPHQFDSFLDSIISDSLCDAGTVKANALSNNFQAEIESSENRSDSDETTEINRKQVIAIKKARKSFRLVLTWNRMLAFMCLSGKSNFSAQQYSILADAIETASKSSETLPTYKTIKGAQWEFMKDSLFPKSSIYYVEKRHDGKPRRPTKTYVKTIQDQLKDPRDCVRIVLPSEWAKMDIITLPIYKQLFNVSVTHRKKYLSIDKAPIVEDRSRGKYLGARCSLWVSVKGTILPTEVNDRVDIHCLKPINYQHYENGIEKWFPPASNPSALNSNYIFRGIVGPAWCVRGKSSSLPLIDSKALNLSALEKCFFNFANKATHTFQDFSTSSKKLVRGEDQDEDEAMGVRQKPNDKYLFLFPGDICTMIRHSEDTDSDHICVLVASFIWREDGRIGERCAWIHKSSILNPERGNRLKISFWTTVAQIPTMSNGQLPSSAYAKSTSPINQGTMEDGSKYVVYRFMLYTDGFNEKKSLNDKRSVCGCYLMPVGLPHHLRNSSLAARPITLGADGQNPNAILDHIVEDIVDGATNGIPTYNASGEKVIIFLDPVALMGDYPAASATADVAGHMAHAFCSFCVVPKRKKTNFPAILYTTKLHSRRLSLIRFDERMKIIRSQPNLNIVKKHLGIRCDSEEEAKSLLSVRLADALRENVHLVPKNVDGSRVLDLWFDSSLSSIAAPDHLFKNLISNLLEVCFLCLSTDEDRRRIDTMICHYIKENGLPCIDTILHWEKNGSFKGINTLTTSPLFCVILFAAGAFLDHASNQEKQLKSCEVQANAKYSVMRSDHDLNLKANASTSAKRQTQPVSKKFVSPFHLPEKLQKVIALLYWWPSTNSDTQSELEYVSGCGELRALEYYKEVLKSAEDYLESIKKYKIEGGRHASILDKPNAHRLIELIVHTLPMFKHTLNVSEMVLETVHRSFKDWLEKNNHVDNHLSAMVMGLARDWASRVFALHSIWKFGESSDKKSAEYGLIRLLLGVEALELDPSSQSTNDLLKEFGVRLEESFHKPVLSQLRGAQKKTLLQTSSYIWKVAFEIDESDYTAIQNLALSQVRSILKAKGLDRSSEMRCFKSAKLFKEEEYIGLCCTNTFNTITVMDYISCLLRESENNEEDQFQMACASGLSVRRCYYRVYIIFQIDKTLTWLVVCPLVQEGKDNKYFESPENRFTLIQLTTAVRRVAAVHYCSSDCKVGTSDTGYNIQHDDGKYIRIYGSQQGYPPHLC